MIVLIVRIVLSVRLQLVRADGPFVCIVRMIVRMISGFADDGADASPSLIVRSKPLILSAADDADDADGEFDPTFWLSTADVDQAVTFVRRHDLCPP